MTIIIPPDGFSLSEFCETQKLSPAQYRTLKRRGLNPQETLIPGTQLIRILAPAYEAWVELLNKPDIQLAEAMRRAAIATRRGRASLASPRHPSNLMRAIREVNKASSNQKRPKKPPQQAAE